MDLCDEANELSDLLQDGNQIRYRPFCLTDPDADPDADSERRPPLPEVVIRRLQRLRTADPGEEQEQEGEDEESRRPAQRRRGSFVGSGRAIARTLEGQKE